MKLKDVNFNGYVFGQSGIQGFFGGKEEYRHRRLYDKIPGYSFKGMVFVAKTFTLEPRIYPASSNTPLVDGYRLRDWFPKSIRWTLLSLIRGYLLNAVGLPNPGVLALLQMKRWQKRADAFQLSFAPMAKNTEEKITEARLVCRFLQENMSFVVKYGMQINLSCPNTGHEQEQDYGDAKEILKVFREMLPDVPLIPKFDLLVEPGTIIALKPHCDAFCIGNTLPFGKRQPISWWKQLYWRGRSPLRKRFGGRFEGGLSGAPLFPLLVEWLKKMEARDPSVKIIAGGGIMKKKQILRLSQFQIVHAVAIGTAAIARPWNVQTLIRYGNNIFSQRKRKQNERNYSCQSCC